LVARGEPRQLRPPAERAPSGARVDLLGRNESFSRAKHQLADLVGEPAQAEKRAVRRPTLGMFALLVEQPIHERELTDRVEHVGWLAVTKRLELFGHDRERQSVDRRHSERGERAPEPLQQGGHGFVAGAVGSHDECDALGIRPRLDRAR
jgi:hypothetical protein